MEINKLDMRVFSTLFLFLSPNLSIMFLYRGIATGLREDLDDSALHLDRYLCQDTWDAADYSCFTADLSWNSQLLPQTKMLDLIQILSLQDTLLSLFYLQWLCPVLNWEEKRAPVKQSITCAIVSDTNAATLRGEKSFCLISMQTGALGSTYLAL